MGAQIDREYTLGDHYVVLPATPEAIGDLARDAARRDAALARELEEETGCPS